VPGNIMRRAAAAILCTTMLAAGSPLWGTGDAQTPVASSPAPRPLGAHLIADRRAPNIVIVLTDDVGFGAASTFGGAIPTPNLDALAAQGLRYNRFHTTAMCSPTRAALLTGRNHHRVEMGGIINLAVGEPGYTSVIPPSAATIGQVLGENGYNTAWFGKNHVTPLWEQSAAGPFDRWPTGLGFEYFYGFMDGASDQFAPVLVENTLPLDAPSGPDYILDKDLTDRAVDWLARQQAAAPDKPFLLYFAPGTAHEPHQAPKEWMEQFRGRFDMGWDRLREDIFARQKSEGIIPADAVLTPRPDAVAPWDSLSSDEKRVASRLMEAHAAMRAYLDHEFGRLVAELKRTGEWDNTLIFFIDGDNGSSPEGGPGGSTLGLLNGQTEPLPYQLARLDEIGGPKGASNYPAGWGWALDTPYQYFKQIASHLGGLRAGMVVNWPARIRDGGAIRSQFGHVNDIAPTIYEAAGIAPPPTVDGVKQMPFDGVSLAYSFTAPTAPSRHREQYFEMLGNVGFYRDGWFASRVPPRIGWMPRVPAGREWQLFDLESDFSQSRDVSARFPRKLAELKRGWERAQRDNGFRLVEAGAAARSDPALRPSRYQAGSSYSFAPSPRPVLDANFPAINNRRWTITVPVELTTGRESGTLVSQGGFPFGWGLYMFAGKPTFLYRNEPQPLVSLGLPKPLAPGRHVIEVSMTPLDARPGGPAEVRLSIDGGEADSMRLESSVRAFFGANGVGIGRDVGTVISDEIAKPFVFTGTMEPLVFRYDD
jgi:arylsulfatase A-like enzyme